MSVQGAGVLEDAEQQTPTKLKTTFRHRKTKKSAAQAWDLARECQEVSQEKMREVARL